MMINLKKIFILLVILGGIVFAPSFLSSSANQNTRIFNLVKQATLGCNSTNFEIWTNETFARSTLLNQTFDRITNNPVRLDKITKKVDQLTSYVISNTRTTLIYHMQKQTSDYLPSQNLIAIFDGFVEVKVVFDWARIGTNPTNGTGTAQGVSQELAIAFRFIQKTSDLQKYELVDYLPFSCENLTLIDLNGTFSQEDKQQINTMVNANPNKNTLRVALEAQVDHLLFKNLDWFLLDRSPLTNEEFYYLWQNSAAVSPSKNYKFTRKSNQFKMMPDGIHYGYETIINDYQNASCGPQISKYLFDPKVYGGLQSYISLTFMQNLLKLAASKNQLDTKLERKYWTTRYFNFMVGELVDIIPNLSHFTPHTDVQGRCKTDENNVRVSKFSNSSLSVSIVSRCNMSVLANPSVEFISFEVTLQLEIDPKLYETTINFWLKSFNSSIVYFPQDNYPITNKQAADKLINSLLEKLYENELFGSGWPIYPNRFYPEILVENDRVFIYEKPRK